MFTTDVVTRVQRGEFTAKKQTGQSEKLAEIREQTSLRNHLVAAFSSGRPQRMARLVWSFFGLSTKITVDSVTVG